MEKDTLKDWTGLAVTIETDEGLTYNGRIFQYDQDFVKLNPVKIHDGYHWDVSRNQAQKMFDKYKVGESDLELLLNRREIRTIYGFVGPWKP